MADVKQSPVAAHPENGAAIGIDRLLRMYRQMARFGSSKSAPTIFTSGR